MCKKLLVLLLVCILSAATLASSGAESVSRHIFTGKQHDERTGLIYFGERYYDSDTARFTTQDPYLGEQNIPQSRHRYVYARSNPTVYWDPTGRKAVDILYGIADTVAGTVANLSAGVWRYVSGTPNFYTAKEVRSRGYDVPDGAGFLDTGYREICYADFRNWKFGKTYVKSSVADRLKNTLGIRPLGETIGVTSGAVSMSLTDSAVVRDRAHYDIGRGIPPIAAAAVMGRAAMRGPGNTRALVPYDPAFAAYQMRRMRASPKIGAVLTAEDVTGRANFVKSGDSVWTAPETGVPIPSHQKLLSKETLFRGTTEGYPGRYGVSPTSTDPAVATHFAVQAETAHGGKGVVYVIPESNVQKHVLPPQRNALPYEFEVPLDVKPLEIPSVSMHTLTTAEVRAILKKAGIDVPARIQTPEQLTQLLKTRTPTTHEQMQIILQELAK